MKNRIIVTLLLGLSAFGSYASDTYRIVNPYESMDPWKPTKGELELRRNDWTTAMERRNEIEATRKRMGIPITDAQYQKEWNAADNISHRALIRSLDAHYFAQPKFPRIERLRDRFSGWIASWYR